MLTPSTATSKTFYSTSPVQIEPGQRLPAVVRLMPGDVIDTIIEDLQNRGTNEAAIAATRAFIEEELGLDVPAPIQYGRWLGVLPQADGRVSGILQGDFGRSLWSKKPVLQRIGPRWPVTLELGLMALAVSQLISLPIGVYSALRQDTLGDYVARSVAFALIAVPNFWIATLVIVLPSIWWGYTPPIMLIRFSDDPLGNLQMFILPAIVLGMGLSGMTMRMTRTMMLEVLRQDYIRTAWAKGLREQLIVVRHGLKNAFIPVVTQIGLLLPLLVGGTVIIENIFGLPGMGQLTLDAISKRDYATVSGLMLLVAAAIMLINLGVDLLYAWLDPRIHYR